MVDESYTDFYNEMEEKFPRMTKLAPWFENDWRSEEVYFYKILTDIAWELVHWVEDGKESDAQRFMDLIENYLNKEYLPIVNPISIDFLVTILEAKSRTRETIKSMMGPETRNSYNILLRGYRELE